MIRVLILDISGVYSQIYDEMYIEQKEEQIIKEKFSDKKYLVIRTL